MGTKTPKMTVSELLKQIGTGSVPPKPKDVKFQIALRYRAVLSRPNYDHEDEADCVYRCSLEPTLNAALAVAIEYLAEVDEPMVSLGFAGHHYTGVHFEPVYVVTWNGVDCLFYPNTQITEKGCYSADVLRYTAEYHDHQKVLREEYKRAKQEAKKARTQEERARMAAKEAQERKLYEDLRRKYEKEGK